MSSAGSNQIAASIWLGQALSFYSVDKNLAIVSRIWDEIWNKGALEVSDEVFTQDYLGHLPIMTVQGPQEFKNLVKVYLAAFPDVHLSVEDAFGVDDRVTVRWISRGTHMGPMMGIPPSQHKIEVMGISIFRMAEGRVAEEWEGFDTLGMMQQLGAAGAAPTGA
ncbi:MAG: ester cyclase [Anaerolineales bacterium]